MTGSAHQPTGKVSYKRMHPGPRDTFVARKIETMPWQKWFAWYPVRVHDKRIWFKTVYRRCINTYVDHDNWSRYEYGTLFDVLKT